jgi:hypothetical protein
MGGKTTIQSAPPAQSVSSQMSDYVKSLPALYEAQMKYDPQLVQQQLELLQQYGLPFAQAYKQAQDALYPETSALQEQLAGQAAEGMESGVPDYMRQQYQSDLRANLGTNIGSGIAADYTSRGLQQQQHDWQNYYRDLGLSLAGRQPLSQPQVSGQSGWMQGYQPNQALQYGASTYGSWAGSHSATHQPSPWGGLAQGAMGMVGGIASGGGTLGGFFQSSKRLKKNIKLWA